MNTLRDVNPMLRLVQLSFIRSLAAFRYQSFDHSISFSRLVSFNECVLIIERTGKVPTVFVMMFKVIAIPEAYRFPVVGLAVRIAAVHFKINK